MDTERASPRYSGIDLWRRGQAEWQASAEPASMIWQTGADASFWIATLALLIAAVAMTAAYAMLARSARNRPRDDRSVLI